MDPRTRHTALDAAIFAACAAFVVAVIFFAVMVVWLVSSEQKTKLYEADNVVCASQPFAITCFERKPR